jgi:hypothetical protein
MLDAEEGTRRITVGLKIAISYITKRREGCIVSRWWAIEC